MRKIAVVDYGMGNLDSVARAMEVCGAEANITDDAGEIRRADSVVLPGVGAFSEGMIRLRQKGLDMILFEEVLQKKKPFLGICLGMQLLADKGDEGGSTKGLGFIAGEVRRLLPVSSEERIPHVGWNGVIPKQASPLLKDIEPETDFYFVHSYHFVCRCEDVVLADTPYCGGFTSVVGQGRIFGVQFHPEKSQRAGFRLIRNFLAL